MHVCYPSNPIQSIGTAIHLSIHRHTLYYHLPTHVDICTSPCTTRLLMITVSYSLSRWWKSFNKCRMQWVSIESVRGFWSSEWFGKPVLLMNEIWRLELQNIYRTTRRPSRCFRSWCCLMGFISSYTCNWPLSIEGNLILRTNGCVFIDSNGTLSFLY